MRVTSKCTCAGSVSVNAILADSRSPSPFGEIVVKRFLSPWNGVLLRLWARMFVRRAGVWSIRSLDVPSTRKPSTRRTRYSPSQIRRCPSLPFQRTSRKRRRSGWTIQPSTVPSARASWTPTCSACGSEAWIRRRFAFGEKSCESSVRFAAAAGGATARATTRRTRRRIGRES